MKILFALGALLLVSFAGLSVWLLNPFNQQSWRVTLNAAQLKRQASILGVNLRNSVLFKRLGVAALSETRTGPGDKSICRKRRMLTDYPGFYTEKSAAFFRQLKICRIISNKSSLAYGQAFKPNRCCWWGVKFLLVCPCDNPHRQHRKFLNNPLVPTQCITAIKLRITLVPKLERGN